jgi:excisionase family DNA binding protein
LDKQIYSIRDISKRWGCHYTTVMRLVNIGVVRGFQVGRTWKITAEALKEFEDNGGYRAYTNYGRASGSRAG